MWLISDLYLKKKKTLILVGKPWMNNAPTAAADFWNARNVWLPTWNLEQNLSRDASLIVDYVRIWAL